MSSSCRARARPKALRPGTATRSTRAISSVATSIAVICARERRRSSSMHPMGAWPRAWSSTRAPDSCSSPVSRPVRATSMTRAPVRRSRCTSSPIRSESPLINDVAVTRTGAWFTDSSQARLFFVPLDGRVPGDFSTLALSGPAAELSGQFNLNGIEATADGSTLIVSHTQNASLYTIDPTTGDSALIANVSLPNVDGIVLQGHRVWAVQNFDNQIAQITLSPDLSSGTVQGTITNSAFEVPDRGRPPRQRARGRQRKVRHRLPADGNAVRGGDGHALRASGGALRSAGKVPMRRVHGPGPDRHQLAPDLAAAAARDRAVRRDRRPGPAQAAARAVPPRAGGPAARVAGSSASSLDDLDDEVVPLLRAATRSTSSRTTASPTTTGTASRSRLFYVYQSAGNEALAKVVDRARGRTRRRRRPAALPQRSAGGRAPRSCSCSARSVSPTARASSWRSRSAPTSRPRCELNDALHATFDESQIFRIDHFLGKEAALNILAFRFANGLFEPIWNRQHIAHVQIDVPETLVDRAPHRVLREDRRVPRHGGEPPVPGARVHGDGTADRARAHGRSAKRRTRCSGR